jgi:protein transport protein SEC13
MAQPNSGVGQVIETGHGGAIHDAQLDYYGKLLATGSSDNTVRIFDAASNRCLAQLQGHDGPVWQIAWAHPKFGHLIASASYDMKVMVWKEVREGDWQVAMRDEGHQASVNTVAFAPWEAGLLLAAGSSDGQVSLHSHKGADQWARMSFEAHPNGVNAVAWCPVAGVMSIASGGCDNQVKIWNYNEASQNWAQSHIFNPGHGDWVRDVAWQPETGNAKTLASVGADQFLLIWTKESDNHTWRQQTKVKLPGKAWRVSWSVTGSLIVVSCGENDMLLYKENLDGEWIPVGKLNDDGYYPDLTSPSPLGGGSGAPAPIGAQPAF